MTMFLSSVHRKKLLLEFCMGKHTISYPFSPTASRKNRQEDEVLKDFLEEFWVLENVL